MNDRERRKNVKEFAEYWKNRGYEKGDSQSFWLDLFKRVLGVENPIDFINFEKPVKSEHTSFIDAYIPSTHVLIEQKSIDRDLRKPTKQPDGTMLTPFKQAKNYADDLGYSQKPRWIVTCNFKEFLIYDMEHPTAEPDSILLENLPKEYYRLEFLINKEDEHIKKEREISIKAGDIVGEIYDELLKQYNNPDDEHSLKSLNMLCVRIVFCLYADDAGIFRHNQFHDYIKSYSSDDMRRALIDLFKVFDTEEKERGPYISEKLNDFPYVNGGLFADEEIEIPKFNDKIRSLILEKASEEFDWSGISPTIFGAVFESTLNPETRRSGGMHYTSVENIHKVIDPLFFNDLRDELNEIKSYKYEKTKFDKLNVFQIKLSKLKFLDPACGSGNFLTETYISLRRLENEAIDIINKGQIMFLDDIIKVSIRQFYGIEINDFAVTVAKTALWIAENQMMKETEDIINKPLEFLPLKSYANIIEANALRIDWESVVPKNELDYIMGNPPFVGMKEQSESNKQDMKLTVPLIKFKQLDYVACWYFKTAQYIHNTNIEAAFVSSNSIVQGEQALTIWKYLFAKENIIINFAYKTFKWDSEANIKAHVHCVIIGFAKHSCTEKILFDGNKVLKCKNINQYLNSGENIFITKVGKPICDVEIMTKGTQLIDGGHFVIGDYKEYCDVIKKEPYIEPYIRKYYNAKDLINNKKTKYVLYLENCPLNIINRSKFIKSRVEAVYNFRANNVSPSTNILKNIPYKYFQSQVPNGKSVVIPVISSENREYIPMCFMPEGMVYTNALFFIDNATLYTFGILNSNVHMSWMRTVCGRMKSDYRYSNTMVYNTFPWCSPTVEQKAKIEQTAQAILDARALYPKSSLADLYDDITMPTELRKAHQENDTAVMNAYGFDTKTMTESECVAKLMDMYMEIIEKEDK